MALFPFFVNIEGMKGLIIGGGKHAWEKVERLWPYGPQLTVIAPEFYPELVKLAEEGAAESALAEPGKESLVTLVHREFTDTDLESQLAFVIVAGDIQKENRRIAGLCKERRIPVNVVDDQEYCDFIFPSLIARGNLSIGICTNGASPGTGVLLKRKMEAQLPEHIEEILDFLQEVRPRIMEALPNKKQRFAFYYELSELCMERNRPLTEAEFAEMLCAAEEA